MFAWDTWPRVFHEVAVRCWLGLLSFEGLTATGGPTSKVAPHMTGQLVLVEGERPQFLFTWASLLGCLNILMAWWLASIRVRNPRNPGRSCNTSGLASEVAPCHSYHILLGSRKIVRDHFRVWLPHLPALSTWNHGSDQNLLLL